MTKGKSWALGIVTILVALGVAGAGRAEEPSPWEFEVEPYGWITGNYGRADVMGRTADIDVTIRDLLELVFDGDAFAAAGYFSARYDRWSVFADAFGGFARESVSEEVPTQLCTLSVAATGTIKPVVADFAVGYRLGQWTLAGRRRPLSLGVYAGARYMHFGVKLEAEGGVLGAVQRRADVSRSFDWADPLIGIRWEVPVLDRLSLDFRSDIGGFGASSDLVWGIAGGVRYWLPWSPWSSRPWLGLGYRVIDFDRTSAGDELNLQLRGPTTGVGFAF